MEKSTLRAAAAAVCALGALALPSASSAAAGVGPTVCNEAEASWQGGYTVTGSGDPNPPARLHGGPGAAMAVGANSRAAERSPALAVCSPGTGGGDPTVTDGENGGDYGNVT